MDDDDNEKMDLFIKRFGKFMMKKGYRARRKKSSSKNKEESRRCFNYGSKDHLVAQCPYNSERLEEAHEKLSKAHKKLEKAHSSLLDEQNKKEAC